MKKGIIRLLIVLYPFITYGSWVYVDRSYDEMAINIAKNLYKLDEAGYDCEEMSDIYGLAQRRNVRERNGQKMIAFIWYPILALCSFWVVNGFVKKEKK